MNQNNSSVSESDQKPAKEEDAATRWRKLIEQHRESGLPVSAYCRERGISPASMFAWRRRLSRGDPPAGSPMFKPVKIVSSSMRLASEKSDSAIELCLSGGCHLIVRRGFDRQLLLEVIEALGPRRCELERRS